MDISNWITHRADWSPDKPAIRFEGKSISYAEFEKRIERLAGALHVELGVKRGDRVAHLGYNAPELLTLFFACARIGAIFVPLNWRLTPSEHEWILGDCTPKAIFVEPDFQDSLRSFRDSAKNIHFVALEEAADGWTDFEELTGGAPPMEPDASMPLDQPVQIVYTSGTTGRPKGSVLTQEAIFYNAINSAAIFEMNARDRVLTVLPMFHVGGMNIQTTPALHAGATVLLHRRFEPEPTMKALAEDRPTLFLAVPAVSQAITGHPEFPDLDLSQLKCFCTGSSTVPEAVIRPWLDRGIPVTQVYGLTESCPIAIAVPLEEGMVHSTSAGKPVPHCQARIVDDSGEDVERGEKGEILLRGPNILKEYWNNPEATAEAFSDGWFHTGDVGHQDEDGWYYVDDRKKDVIISGGENIYPAELENVLADCPKLAEFTVVGRPDERWGETPVAVVVMKEGEEMTKDEVLGLFEERLARYKHPRDVVFTSGPLPRTTLGKVQKFEVRQEIAGGKPAPR